MNVVVVLSLSLLLCQAYAAAVSDSTILAIQDQITAGNLAEAEKAVAGALASDPRNGGLRNLAGVIHAQRNEMDVAQVDFEQALRLEPRLVSAYLNYGRVCEWKSSSQPAALNAGIRAYRRLLAVEPGQAPVRLQLAKLLAWNGDFADSVRELNRLTPQDQNGKTAELLRAVALGRKALTVSSTMSSVDENDIQDLTPALTKSHNDTLLIHLLETAQARRPLSLPSRHLLAAAYEREGRLEHAISTLESAFQTNQSDSQSLLDLARLSYNQHQFERALGYLAHARQLSPDDATLHFFFGVICIEMDLPLEAKKALDRALELNPDNTAYNYARGSVELQGRSTWLAVPFFEKVISAEPANSRGHFALGVAQFGSKDYDAAATHFALAARGEETRAGAEYFLGRIAKVHGEWAEAARSLAVSIQIAPDYAESHAELGLAAMHLGDIGHAREELQRALELRPDSYLVNANLLTFYQSTKDPLADAQRQRLQSLDEQRSKKQELMLRMIKVNPYK